MWIMTSVRIQCKLYREMNCHVSDIDRSERGKKDRDLDGLDWLSDTCGFHTAVRGRLMHDLGWDQILETKKGETERDKNVAEFSWDMSLCCCNIWWPEGLFVVVVVVGNLPYTILTKMTKEMQLCRIIYYFIVSWLLYMFRAILSPIIRSILTVITASGFIHMCCCRPLSWQSFVLIQGKA
jgi:hypothetical protein